MLEGKGLTSGWWLLAEKLHFLGVVAKEGSKEGDFVGEASVGSLHVINGVSINGRKEKCSYAEVVNPISVVGGESVCVEVGEEDFKDKFGQMECCLVGWWKEALSPILELEAVRKWAIFSWMPKGRLNLVRLGRKLLLFEFENPSEADRVLKFGRWSLRGYLLHLERWNQDIGCVRSKDLGKEV